MVAKNYLYNLMYQILNIVIPIITIPYISRVLGAEGVGVYALTTTYAQYFVIFGMLGLSSYSSREIAYVKDNAERLSNTFWEINFLRFITMGISLLCYIIIFIIAKASNYKVIYLIQSLLILSSIFDISWLFIGLENFKKISIRNIIVKLIGIILVLVLVKDRSQVWLYALLLGAVQFVGQIIMWFDIPKSIVYKSPNKYNIFKHLRYSIRLFIPQIAVNVYTMLDKVMLGAYSNEAEVGLYDNSQKIINILITIVTSLAVVTIPQMANLYKNQKYEEFNKNVYKSFSFVSFLAFPMTFGLIGICKSFVPWFYGEEFKGIIPILYIGSFLMIPLSWNSILGNQVLISTKREKKYTVSVSISAIINIILNVITISKFRGIGTMFSSVISQYCSVLIMSYSLKDTLNLWALFKQTIRYLMASMIMLIIMLIFSFVVDSTFIGTIVLVIIGTMVYLIIMFVMKDDNLVYIFNFIKKLLKYK